MNETHSKLSGQRFDIGLVDFAPAGEDVLELRVVALVHFFLERVGRLVLVCLERCEVLRCFLITE